MQTILVLPYDKADYVHNEEVLQIQHLASKTNYQILAKDLDDPELLQGRVGILIPLELVEDLVVKEGYLSIVLSHKEGKALAERWGEIGEALERSRSGKRMPGE